MNDIDMRIDIQKQSVHEKKNELTEHNILSSRQSVTRDAWFRISDLNKNN